MKFSHRIGPIVSETRLPAHAQAAIMVGVYVIGSLLVVLAVITVASRVSS